MSFRVTIDICPEVVCSGRCCPTLERRRTSLGDLCQDCKEFGRCSAPAESGAISADVRQCEPNSERRWPNLAILGQFQSELEFDPWQFEPAASRGAGLQIRPFGKPPTSRRSQIWAVPRPLASDGPDRFRPNRRCRRCWPSVGPHRPISGRGRPRSGSIRPRLADFSELRTELDTIIGPGSMDSTVSARHRPKSGRLLGESKFGLVSIESQRLRPNLGRPFEQMRDIEVAV